MQIVPINNIELEILKENKNNEVVNKLKKKYIDMITIFKSSSDDIKRICNALNLDTFDQFKFFHYERKPLLTSLECAKLRKLIREEKNNKKTLSWKDINNITGKKLINYIKKTSNLRAIKFLPFIKCFFLYEEENNYNCFGTKNPFLTYRINLSSYFEGNEFVFLEEDWKGDYNTKTINRYIGDIMYYNENFIHRTLPIQHGIRHELFIELY